MTTSLGYRRSFCTLAAAENARLGCRHARPGAGSRSSDAVSLYVNYLCGICGRMFKSGFESCCLCDEYMFHHCKQTVLGRSNAEKRVSFTAF